MAVTARARKAKVRKGTKTKDDLILDLVGFVRPGQKYPERLLDQEVPGWREVVKLLEARGKIVVRRTGVTNDLVVSRAVPKVFNPKTMSCA